MHELQAFHIKHYLSQGKFLTALIMEHKKRGLKMKMLKILLASAKALVYMALCGKEKYKWHMKYKNNHKINSFGIDK